MFCTVFIRAVKVISVRGNIITEAQIIKYSSAHGGVNIQLLIMDLIAKNSDGTEFLANEHLDHEFAEIVLNKWREPY